MNVQQLVRFYQQYKKLLLIAGFIIGGILFFTIQYLMKVPITEQSHAPNALIAEESSTVPEKENNTKLFVDIKGAILHPGLYEVLPESRVANLIELAGGLTEQADAKQINLAQLLQDEMVVYIPMIGEEGVVQANEAQTAQGNDRSKINLNKATLEELQKIPGVGQKKAEAILQYREEKGAFKKIEEITEISGIGPNTFEKLKEFISVQ